MTPNYLYDHGFTKFHRIYSRRKPFGRYLATLHDVYVHVYTTSTYVYHVHYFYYIYIYYVYVVYVYYVYVYFVSYVQVRLNTVLPSVKWFASRLNVLVICKSIAIYAKRRHTIVGK